MGELRTGRGACGRQRAVFFTDDPVAAFGLLDDYFPGLAGDTTSRCLQLVELEVLAAS